MAAKPRKPIQSNLRRRVGCKSQLRRILIVCEGEKTEPNYFRCFKTGPEVVVRGVGMNTVSLVNEAIKLRDEAEDRGESYSEVWVVFDKDDFPWRNVRSALDLADSAGVSYAYSIESFELWYLLHFDYCDSRLSRADYCDKLSVKLGRKYRKNDSDIYKLLLHKLPAAIRNASTLYNKKKSLPLEEQNPITLVFRLVKRLLGPSEEFD